MMKYTRKMIASLLAALLVVGVIPFPAFAAAENTPKEEVVYINLNADGSVQEINVVNIFELAYAGQIVDYGDYESIRNMTSTTDISYADGVITADAGAGKLYYEGKLSSMSMPWTISIKYFMDGVEHTARELAGKSGDLKITIDITENPDCAGNFFEGFALQASVTLDTSNCTNITAEGATVANVGRNKQLTYTILPNTGASIEITAKVTDFEMTGISINGVKLNLEIEVDDAAIQDMIDDVVDAVTELDDGANALNGGADELFDGTSLLDSKTQALHDGVEALTSGSASLSTGLNTIAKNNETVLNGAYSAFQGLCTAAEGVLNTELTKNGFDAINLTPETYATVLENLLKAIDFESSYDVAYEKALSLVTSEVEANADALYAGYIEQNASAIYETYIQSQAEAIYTQVAMQTIQEQLIANGLSAEDAAAFFDTTFGQTILNQVLNGLTDEQKEQILSAALASLTDEQKEQIKAGAVASLTEDQKAQIRNGYIEQTMKSESVTEQILEAVAAADSAVVRITELKCQLDNYSLFYDGLQEYTSAVSEAATGAATLNRNMETLYTNVGSLATAIGELTIGAETLSSGASQLLEGTGEFAEATSGIADDVSDEVSSMIATATGSDVELVSFVSEDNINIDAVQFVIQSESIEIIDVIQTEPEVEETLTFWQKLLRLFGLY